MKYLLRSTLHSSLLLALLLVGASAVHAGPPCGPGGCVQGTYTEEHVTLTANPTSITVGQAVLLTWSSTVTSAGNPTSLQPSWCIANFNMGGGTYDPGSDSTFAGPVSGSVYVYPSANKTYTVTCSTAGAAGYDTPGSASVSVTAAAGLNISCSASPTTATTGQTVTWTGSASGGTGPYTYKWGGDDGLAGLTGRVVSLSYSAAGTKNGVLQVTDSSGGTTSNYSKNYNNGNGVDAGGYTCNGPVLAGYGSSYTEDYPVLNAGSTHDNGGPGFYLQSADGYNAPPDYPSNTNYCVQVTMRQQACGTLQNPARDNCEPNTSINTVWHSGTGVSSVGTEQANQWHGTESFTSGSSVTPPRTATVACSNAVTVTAPASPPSATLSANPTSIQSGSSSSLSYSCVHASSGSIDNSVGAVSADGSTHSVTVRPTITTTYTLSCVAPNAAPGGNVWVNTSYVPGKCTSTSFTQCPGNQPPSPGFDSCSTVGATCTYCNTDNVLGEKDVYTCQPSSSNTPPTAYAHATVTVTPACVSNIGASCNSSANSCGQTNTGTVQCDGSCSATRPPDTSCTSPDLTAGAISPTSATTAVAQTFTAPISNLGSAATGAGFVDLFQRATDSNGSNATDIGTYSSAAIAASGSNTASLSYSFSPAGTYYMRACADKSSAGNAGVITESNENNNCGAWTAITVTDGIVPPPGGPSISCTASPSSVSAGGPTVTYTAFPVGGAGAPYTWTASDGATGLGSAVTATRSFPSAGSYSMSVRDGVSGSTAVCSPLVTVGNGACTGAESATITATPNRVPAGNSGVRLDWTATNAVTSCHIYGPGVDRTISINSCSVNGVPIQTPQIVSQSVYHINCDNGAATAQAIVNILPSFQEF